MTPTTINHASFPAIIDEILHHAPWQVLTSFRATNRSFCTRINTLQLHHIKLTSRGMSSPYAPASYGRIPCTMGGIPLPDKTRVLDIPGDWRGLELGVLKMRELTNIQVVRIMGGECNFDALELEGVVKVIAFGKVGCPADGGVWEVWRKIDVEKLVVNVEWGEGEVCWVGSMSTRTRLRELVYVFTHWRPGDVTQSENDVLDRWERMMENLATVISSNPRIGITIVDFDAVDPGWFGIHGLDPRELLAGFAGSTVNKMRMREGESEITTTVEFVSGEEYASRLSVEEYRLETLEYLGDSV